MKKIKLDNYSFETICYSNVWGNGTEPVPMTYLEPGDINFIHANDEVNKYWKIFTLDKCSNYFVVCYSGAGVKGLLWNNPKHFAFEGTINTEEDIKTKLHLKEFIVAVQNNHTNPFYKLIGFEPILEAKLELLHQCLTPDSIDGAQKVLDKLKTLLNCDSEKQKTFDTAFKTFKSSVKNEKDCFSDNYVTALSVLRESLLANLS